MDHATAAVIMRYVIPRSENGDGTSDHHEGVRTSVKQVVSASARYAVARMRLAVLETKLAARDVKKATLFLTIALIGALTGFALLITGLVLWVARLLLNGNTAAASAIIGAVLLAGAFFLSRGALRSMRGKSFYPVTKTELNRDKQWLHKLP